MKFLFLSLSPPFPLGSLSLALSLSFTVSHSFSLSFRVTHFRPSIQILLYDTILTVWWLKFVVHTRTDGVVVELRGGEQAEEAEKALKDALRTIEHLKIAAASQALRTYSTVKDYILQ